MKNLIAIPLAFLLLLLIGTGVASAESIFSDTFEERTTGTLTPDYTVLGGDVEVVSTTQIDGNIGNGLRLFSEDTVELTGLGDQSNFRLEFDLKGGVWDHVVAFRASDVDNGYQFVFNNGSVSIYKVVGGTRTLLARGLNFKGNVWQRFTIEAVDNEIMVTDNEGLLMRVTDDTYASGRFFFSAFVNAQTLIDNLLIEATNEPPIAVVGLDQTIIVGSTAQLDGTDSSDPDGDPITYSWSLVGLPAESAAALVGADTATPGLAPDEPGEYLVDLVVSDGFAASDPARVTINAVTPGQSIQDLIGLVNGMGLPKGVQNSLSAPLKNAANKLSDDNPNNDGAACGELNAFTNQVDAKEGSGKLTQDQADQLRQAAESIKDALGCKK